MTHGRISDNYKFLHSIIRYPGIRHESRKQRIDIPADAKAQFLCRPLVCRLDSGQNICAVCPLVIYRGCDGNPFSICKVIKRCGKRGGTDIHGCAAALFPGMPPYLGCVLSAVHRHAISLTVDDPCRLTGDTFIYRPTGDGSVCCIRRDQHIDLLLPAYGKLQAACLCHAHFTRQAHATASFFLCEQPPLICRRLWCLRHKAHAAPSTGSLSAAGCIHIISRSYQTHQQRLCLPARSRRKFCHFFCILNVHPVIPPCVMACSPRLPASPVLPAPPPQSGMSGFLSGKKCRSAKSGM